MIEDKEENAKKLSEYYEYIKEFEFGNSTEEYYKDEHLNFILMQDIYSAGVLVLECIQDFPRANKSKQLSDDYIKYLLEICLSHYSKYFTTLITGMVGKDITKRWNLKRIQSYLNDLYSDEREYVELEQKDEEVEDFKDKFEEFFESGTSNHLKKIEIDNTNI